VSTRPEVAAPLGTGRRCPGPARDNHRGEGHQVDAMRAATDSPRWSRPTLRSESCLQVGDGANDVAVLSDYPHGACNVIRAPSGASCDGHHGLVGQPVAPCHSCNAIDNGAGWRLASCSDAPRIPRRPACTNDSTHPPRIGRGSRAPKRVRASRASSSASASTVFPEASSPAPAECALRDGPTGIRSSWPRRSSATRWSCDMRCYTT